MSHDEFMFAPARTRKARASETEIGSVRLVLLSGEADLTPTVRGDEAILSVTMPGPPLPDSGLAFRRGCVAFLACGATPGREAPASDRSLHVIFPLGVLDGLDVDASIRYDIDSSSALFWPFLVFTEALAVGGAVRTALANYYTERLLQEMIAGVAVASIGQAASRPQHSYAAAMSMINASAGDSSLTPSRLAEDLNVSLRTLQRQFSRRGATVDRAIRQARVKLAMQLLTDPAYGALSVEKIALACGLSNGSSLARAFAAEGLVSPSAARREAQGQSSDARNAIHARPAFGSSVTS